MPFHVFVLLGGNSALPVRYDARQGRPLDSQREPLALSYRRYDGPSILMTFALLLLASYLLGSVPVGVLVARARGVDILKEGSGNIGATNVGRVLGKGPGLAVWGLDVLKSLAPTLAARTLLPHGFGPLAPDSTWFLVGAMAILGHCASPFLGFRGGKGISTALGAIVGVAPLVALLCFALFTLVLWATRYMAIASTVGVLSVVPFGLILGVSHQLLPIFLALGLFVVYRHRSNFRRLREGTEPKFSFKKAGAPAQGGGDKGASRLRLNGNDQLPDPHQDGLEGSHVVQIVDSIIAQFLAQGHRLDLTYRTDDLKITIDDRPNGQLPLELAAETIRRLALIAGMDPLKHLQPRTGAIRGTFDDEPFEIQAESFPVMEGIAIKLVRIDLEQKGLPPL